jgi:site-specific recombinase XerD
MARHCALTHHEALERWLAVKLAGRGLSINTIKAYRADIATFAAYLAGVGPSDRMATTRARVGALTPEAVTDALSAMRQARAADKTRARLYGTVASVLSYLVQQGHLDSDPLVDAGLQRPGVSARLPRYIDSPSEFAQILEAAAAPDPSPRRPWPERELALAALLAGTAARAGEICSLTLRDLVLDTDEPYARVLRKRDVARDCPLTAELVQVIRNYGVPSVLRSRGSWILVSDIRRQEWHDGVTRQSFGARCST